MTGTIHLLEIGGIWAFAKERLSHAFAVLHVFGFHNLLASDSKHPCSSTDVKVDIVGWCFKGAATADGVIQ